MKENYSNIERLILCSIRGELTEKEDKELKEWMGESEMNRLLYDRLASEDEFEKKLREYIAIDVEGALQKTRQRIEKTEHSRRLLWRVVPAAVAAVLAALF